MTDTSRCCLTSAIYVQKDAYVKQAPHMGGQGCALAVPRGFCHLTFVLGKLGNLSFVIKLVNWAPWISQVTSAWFPFVFLRAQPWRILFNYQKAWISIASPPWMEGRAITWPPIALCDNHKYRWVDWENEGAVHQPWVKIITMLPDGMCSHQWQFLIC